MTGHETDNRDLAEEEDDPYHGVLSGAMTLVSTFVSPVRAIGRPEEAAGESRRTGRATGSGSSPVGERLLSPSERILTLLERNDGRMEQSEIVQTVEWSESTVSRKLGTLEADGSISRYRIGRGKLVFLPGAEPDCLGSARDDEDEQERPPLVA